MDPARALIDRLLANSAAAELATLNNDQLVAAQRQLTAYARSVRAGEVDGIDPDDVHQLQRIADAVQVLRGEQDRRGVSRAAASVQRPPLGELLDARPAAARPRPGEMVARPRWQLNDGRVADAHDVKALAERFSAAMHDAGRSEGGPGRVTVARCTVELPVALRRDDPWTNSEKLDEVTAAAREPWSNETLEAVTASGGWCAPLSPEYEIPNLASTTRPVRDALPRVGADRGGIQHARAGRLSSIVTGGPSQEGAAISLWTAAIDESPGGSVKRRQTIACRSIVEAELDAVVARLRFGNLHARAYPEDVAHTIRLAMAAHARIAERNLLDRLISLINVDVTQTGLVGTARDAKHHLLQAASEIRYTERLGDARIRAIVSDVLPAQIVADLTMQQPGDNALLADEAWARQFLQSTGLLLTYAEDVPTGADAFVTNSDGESLANWPSNFEIPVYPDGSAVFLDGGELNLGFVRDTTLNDTNDFELFVETFEGLAWLGPYAKVLTLTTCPNGTSQAALEEATANLCAAS